MRFDVACAGEILVDVIPTQAGFYREGMLFEVHFGGAPANVAVGVARLGVSSAFIGAVGNDLFGEMLLKYLEDMGVYTGFVVRKKARTSLAFVVAKQDGERDFFFYREPWVSTADAQLEEQDIDLDAIKKVKVLHVSGVSLSQPPLSNTIINMMKTVFESGGQVSLDPNYRSDIWLNEITRAKTMFRNALKYSTLLMLGYDEMSPLLGSEDYRKVADKLFSDERHLRYVAIRLGAKGAYVASRNGEEVQVDAFRVPVVDTTGAGDAWAAGFLTFALCEKRDLRESVLLANAVAAIKCTRRGATAGMPTREELKAFLSNRSISIDL
ncbi:MAG: sugar kinase [Thermofilaceae archaeon]|nr:sugar kinase [Thermofilaceae archaeon]MCX8180390.1 sugar kinase [Thermofilaceae archaeon]MDW8003925.1 sugar kinase [Thermofilaceae archaeon]